MAGRTARRIAIFNLAWLRGAEISREPGSDARRILVLGDSAAYGWGLAEADTFPILLGSAFAGGASLFWDLQHPDALGMRVAASATAEFLTR